MFITLEGPEGSGKTCQIQKLAERLRATGRQVLTTREPGGTAIGDQIRSVLTRMENTAMNPRTEILLFQASRAQLVEEVIRPNLALRTIVLCDRYGDSTLAYQGYGHGYDLALLSRLISFATGGLTPDLTLLLDIDPQVGLNRKRGSPEWNRLDDYELSFHQKVRAGFLELAAAEPQRWVTIDASQPLEVVQEELLKIVTNALYKAN